MGVCALVFVGLTRPPAASCQRSAPHPPAHTHSGPNSGRTVGAEQPQRAAALRAGCCQLCCVLCAVSDAWPVRPAPGAGTSPLAAGCVDSTWPWLCAVWCHTVLLSVTVHSSQCYGTPTGDQQRGVLGGGERARPRLLLARLSALPHSTPSPRARALLPSSPLSLSLASSWATQKPRELVAAPQPPPSGAGSVLVSSRGSGSCTTTSPPSGPRG